jgi:hypothetical protein
MYGPFRCFPILPFRTARCIPAVARPSGWPIGYLQAAQFPSNRISTKITAARRMIRHPHPGLRGTQPGSFGMRES